MENYNKIILFIFERNLLKRMFTTLNIIGFIWKKDFI
jgi:hypothetical protein